MEAPPAEPGRSLRRPSARPMLYGLLAGALAVAGARWGLGFLARQLVLRQVRAMDAAGPALPPFFKQPQVVVPMDGLGKRIFASVPTGGIADMRLVGSRLVLAGRLQAVVLDPNGRVETVGPRFPDWLSDGRVVELPSGGYGFMSGGNAHPRLFDAQGKVLWQAPEDAAEAMAVGALDAKGPPLVALTQPDRVELWTLAGKRLWSRPVPDPWDVAFLEADGRRGRRLASGVNDGRLVLWDAQGRRTVRKTDVYLGHFVPIRWPGPAGRPALLTNGKGELLVMDARGRTLARLESLDPFDHAENVVLEDNVSDRSPVSACYVRLKAGGPSYLAVSVAFDPYERSSVNLYDASGQLVYSDFVTRAAGPLLAVPSSDHPGAQRLLAAGDDSVDEYGL